MRISVTEEDILSGKSGAGGLCPIALAATRAFGRNCFVDTESIWITNSTYSDWLPQEAAEFVSAFDRHQSVSPFTFEVHDAPGQ